jgi:hypothetical protein
MVLYRQKAVGGRVAVYVDGGTVRYMEAGTQRASRLLEQAPDSVAGVYDGSAKREQIIADLLVVLSHD